MNMFWVEIIVVNILLVIAAICEKKSGQIPPAISGIGCVVGVACSVVGGAICSWQEDLITLIISFVLIIVINTKTNGVLGGGVLKVLAMTAAYFGYDTLFVFGIFVLCLAVVIYISANKHSEENVLAVPLVLVSSLLTSVLVYFVA